jgi:hypothetical protein
MQIKTVLRHLGSTPKLVGGIVVFADLFQFRLNNSRAALPYDSPSPNILGGAKDVR